MKPAPSRKLVVHCSVYYCTMKTLSMHNITLKHAAALYCMDDLIRYYMEGKI